MGFDRAAHEKEKKRQAKALHERCEETTRRLRAEYLIKKQKKKLTDEDVGKNIKQQELFYNAK